MTRPPVTGLRLSADNVSLAGRVHGLSFDVQEGSCLVIVGPNGAGKSSLLHLLSGLSPPTSGTVTLTSKSRAHADAVHRIRAQERAAFLAWLPQRPTLGEGLFTEEVVAAGRYRFGESPDVAQKAARLCLQEAGATNLIGRSIDAISGGELQRVLLATLVAQEAPFLLVDEPANHLDPAHQVSTYKRLGALYQSLGRALVIVTHDIRLAHLLGPPSSISVLGMKAGAQAFTARLSDPTLPAHLSTLYGVPFESGPQGLQVALPPLSLNEPASTGGSDS